MHPRRTLLKLTIEKLAVNQLNVDLGKEQFTIGNNYYNLYKLFKAENITLFYISVLFNTITLRNNPLPIIIENKQMTSNVQVQNVHFHI